jgi:hypothetical protein
VQEEAWKRKMLDDEDVRNYFMTRKMPKWKHFLKHTNKKWLLN